MTRLGHSISCISAIGSDSLGGELLNEYRKLGLNVDNMLIVPPPGAPHTWSSDHWITPRSFWGLPI